MKPTFPLVLALALLAVVLMAAPSQADTSTPVFSLDLPFVSLEYRHDSPNPLRMLTQMGQSYQILSDCEDWEMEWVSDYTVRVRRQNWPDMGFHRWIYTEFDPKLDDAEFRLGRTDGTSYFYDPDDDALLPGQAVLDVFSSARVSNSPDVPAIYEFSITFGAHCDPRLRFNPKKGRSKVIASFQQHLSSQIGLDRLILAGPRVTQVAELAPNIVAFTRTSWIDDEPDFLGTTPVFQDQFYIVDVANEAILALTSAMSPGGARWITVEHVWVILE